MNNFIYGLTNSQTSPTTPKGFWTVTAPGGNIDNQFDICELGAAAGATFVARESILDPKKLEKVLIEGFKHKGFSLFDINSNCHVNLGRKNKMIEATDMLKWLDSRILPKRKYDELSEEEKKGKFPTGILKHDTETEEYCEAYAAYKAKVTAKKGGH